MSHVGVIWRTSQRRGLAEIFSEPPLLGEVRSCVRKHAYLHHGLSLKLGNASVAVPDLWVLSSGRPDAVLSKLKMEPAEGWPRGFYFLDGLSPLWVIALTELMDSPETRVLRLCSTPEMRRLAVAEIDALPEKDPTRQPLLSTLFVI